MSNALFQAHGLQCTTSVTQTWLSPAAELGHQQIPASAMEAKSLGGSAHNYLELVGSVVVAMPTDYTRYMNRLCIHIRKVAGTVKLGAS